MIDAVQHDEHSWDHDEFDSVNTSEHEKNASTGSAAQNNDTEKKELPLTRKQMREARRAELEIEADNEAGTVDDEVQDVLRDEERAEDSAFVSLAEEFGARELLLESEEDSDLLNPAVVHWQLIGLEKDKKGNYPSKSDLVENPPILFVNDDQGSMTALMMTQQVAVPLYKQLTIMRNIYSGKPAIEKKPRTISERFVAGIDYWFSHKIKGTIVVLMSVAFIYAAGSGAWSIVAGY